MNNNVNSSFLNNQYAQLRKEIAEQDVYRAFVQNANSVAPQTPRGFLLKSRNPLSSLVISAADTGKDIVELGKALTKGESNDNQLGRFNDLGMKLGGLGIASYLFTRRGTGTKGLMEFLGFGAFFASMAMWPKVLISEPMKHRFGFDFRQKYVDSQGRKKYFFQDNQYQPWDLWSNDELNKIGDKLGVPKDVKDREELIKEKMRTIALQGNTLWMLTAGFSPLLTSMMCNVAERGITKGLINHQYNKITADVDKLPSMIQAKMKDANFDSQAARDLAVITTRRTKEPDKVFFNNVSHILDPFRVINDKKDIDDSNLIFELRSTALQIRDNMMRTYSDLREAKKGTTMVNYGKLVEEMDKLFAEQEGKRSVVRSLQGRDNSADRKVYMALRQKFAHIDKLPETERVVPLGELLEALDSTEGAMTKAALRDKFARLIEGYKIEGTIDGKVVSDYCASFGDVYQKQTRPIAARLSVISDFINGLVGQKYESVHTGIHLDSLNAFMAQLKPKTKDLKQARNSAEQSQKYLVSSLSKIAGNEGRYGEYISTLSEKQVKFESKTLGKILDKIRRAADDAFKGVEDVENDNLFGFLKQSVQNGKSGRTPLYRRVVDLFIEEKTAGIKSTGHRYILAADLEKRIADGTLAKQWESLGGDKEAIKDVIQTCRRILYDSTMNDVANKCYLSGNGVDSTKVLELLFGQYKNEANELVSTLDADTLKHCNPALYDSLLKTRENIYRIYSQIVDLARQGHTLQGKVDVSQKTQYSMIGKSLNELFMETASQKFNDRHWMRMFGGLAIGVVGITLLSQMFFGKAKNEHLYLKHKEQKGGDNAVK